MNPPRNKKIIGFAYGAAASRMGMMPIVGNRMSGKSAVTGMGTASVTHQTIIQAVNASTLLACGEMKPSGKSTCAAMNRRGPSMNASCRPLSIGFTEAYFAWA
jgi:hypothetical protein